MSVISLLVIGTSGQVYYARRADILHFMPQTKKHFHRLWRVSRLTFAFRLRIAWSLIVRLLYLLFHLRRMFLIIKVIQ